MSVNRIPKVEELIAHFYLTDILKKYYKIFVNLNLQYLKLSNFAFNVSNLKNLLNLNNKKKSLRNRKKNSIILISCLRYQKR